MTFYNKIIICNLYSYYGTQVVNFKSKEDKNLYLIYGDNGFGKTSFIKSLKLLFKGTPFSKSQNILFDGRSLEGRFFFGREGSTNEGLFNKKAVYEDKNEFFIELHLVYNDREITIKRKWKVYPNIKETLSFIDEENEYYGNMAQEKINQILPQSFVDFFIFDGEEIGKMAEELRGELKSKIQDILNIKPLDKAINQTRKLRRDYAAKSMSNQQSVNELKANEHRLEEARSSLELCKEKIKSQSKILKDEKEALRREEANKEEILQNKGEKMGRLQTELKYCEENLNVAKEGFLQNSHAILFLNLNVFCQEIIEKIQINQKRNNIKSKQLQNIKDDFSKKLAEKLHKKLNNIDSYDLRDIIIESFEDIIKQGDNDEFADFELNGLDIRLENALKEALKLAKNICNIQELSSSYVNTQRRLNELIDENNDVDIQKQEEELQNLQQSIKKHEKDLEAFEHDENNLNRAMQEYEENIEHLTNSIQKDKRLSRQMELCEKVYDGLKAYKDTLISKLLNELKYEILANYKLIISNDNIDCIEVDDKFSITLKGIDGNEISIQSQSAGQKQAIAIAIFWALSKLSHRELPLVIDTPLSRIDKTNRKNIIENYYFKASNEVIILPHSGEFDAYEYQIAKDQIAQSFIITNSAQRNSSQIVPKNMKDIIGEI